jgi:thioredoxin 1
VACVLAACAVLVLVAAGCGASKARLIRSEEEFNDVVLKADRPVLVEFYKGGCAGCLFLDPCMDQLADEYRDCVLFTKFELETFWMKITCPPLWKRYHIGLFPTVLLFVNGKEKKRWAVNYSRDAYRQVLEDVLGAAIPKEAPPKSEGPADLPQPRPVELGGT